MMQMNVRIDATWHDDALACIDHSPGRLRRQRARSGHRRDGLPGNRDVAMNNAVGCNHVATTNDRIEQSCLPNIALLHSRLNRHSGSSPPALYPEAASPG